MPETDEIFGWIEDLWRFGAESKYRYRMPGSDADHSAARYIEKKFSDSGLHDVQREKVPIGGAFPDKWELLLCGAFGERKLPCYFLRYAAFTPPEGITAPIVHVGQGSEDEFEALRGSVAGKIVLVDLVAPPWKFSTDDAVFVHDPNGTLVGDSNRENFPLVNLVRSIALARRFGAVGYIGILVNSQADNCQMYHGPRLGTEVITALTISPNSGRELKKLLKSGNVEATLTLTEQLNPERSKQAGDHVFGRWGLSYNLSGILPGTSEDAFVVMSHHDGSATNEGSGAAMVMALAKYFKANQSVKLRRTIVFLTLASHFGFRPPVLEHCQALVNVKDRIAAVFVIEMIARQYKIINEQYEATGLIAPTAFGVVPSKPQLVDIVRDAIVNHGLERSAIWRECRGEGKPMARAGLTVVERIAGSAPQFSDLDTPETVMKDALRPTACAFADIIRRFDDLSSDHLAVDGAM